MTVSYWWVPTAPIVVLPLALIVIWGVIRLHEWYRRRQARRRMRTQYLVKTDPDGRAKVYPFALLPAGYQLRENEHVEWR